MRMLINLLKYPLYRCSVENEKVTRHAHADPYQHRKLITSFAEALVDVRFRVRELSYSQTVSRESQNNRQTDRQIDRQNDRSHN